MVISARYSSLTRCCTWWLNSPPASVTRELPALDAIRVLKRFIHCIFKSLFGRRAVTADSAIPYE